MSSIRVEVTADDIGDDLPRLHWAVPVERALRRLTGQDVDIDGNGSNDRVVAEHVVTIGALTPWAIVVDLPEAANTFLQDRWDARGPGEPFVFDLEVPEWIVALIAKAATVDEQAMAVMASETRA